MFLEIYQNIFRPFATLPSQNVIALSFAWKNNAHIYLFECITIEIFAVVYAFSFNTKMIF